MHQDNARVGYCRTGIKTRMKSMILLEAQTYLLFLTQSVTRIDGPDLT
jgi:hypothetical protein